MSRSPARSLLLRGLRQHLEVRRHGTPEERELSSMGLRLLRDLVLRLSISDVGRALDYAIAPSFRAVEVRAPVFVVAPPRSGTTLLYSLLAADPQMFAPRLYETLLPSLALLRTAEAIGGFAKRYRGGRLAEGFSRWEEGRFAESDPIHRVRHRELEEDTLLFDRHLMCPSSLRFFPRGEELVELTALDDQPPAARVAVMEAYHRALQRLLHRAPGRTYLAKNVHSAGRIGSLWERFPDARFIHIVRQPYEVIPSAVRLFRVSNYLGLPPGQRPEMPIEHPMWRMHAELVIETYQRLLRWERRIPSSQWITLRFSDLVADPMGTVGRVYEHLGMPRSAVAEQAQLALTEQAGRHRSSDGSAARLEDLGLSRDQVFERLREVFEAYELSR